MKCHTLPRCSWWSMPGANGKDISFTILLENYDVEIHVHIGTTGGTTILSQLTGYPHLVLTGGTWPGQYVVPITPVKTGWGTPQQDRMGYSAPQKTKQHTKYLLRGRWYASCVHAGRLGDTPIQSRHGVPPLMDKVKILPSVILRMRAVAIVGPKRWHTDLRTI